MKEVFSSAGVTLLGIALVHLVTKDREKELLFRRQDLSLAIAGN